MRESNWIDSDPLAVRPMEHYPMTQPIEPPPPSAAPSVHPESRQPEATGSEPPIAIVGMACRFPGADGIPAFWRLLDDGVNAVQEGEPGSGVGRVGALFPSADVQAVACRFGAYLDGLDQFDAAFFRISPVEAQLLDPQQRLMLETCWRALEDAGMDPERLRGSRTGVYAGISNNEYRNLILEVSDTAEPAASLYTVTGTSFNTAIGRVAFALGLEGPAMAVDTACSSSLVAMHQAVTGTPARRVGPRARGRGAHHPVRAAAGASGKCRDAVAGRKVRDLRRGRERLRARRGLRHRGAQAARRGGSPRRPDLGGDPGHGAQPGRGEPGTDGAERAGAGEVHWGRARARPASSPRRWTTWRRTAPERPVGDPIELEATAAAYGRGRDPERPLLIGSVKTNIGHLESAAGVAGVIKTILAMKHGVIPKHLHFRTPNPEMDWDRLPLRVTAEPTPWPLHEDHPPTAGVSGFGWSGTNAHVVLEGYGVSGGAPAGVRSGHWAAGAARPVAVSLPESVTHLLSARAAEEGAARSGTSLRTKAAEEDAAHPGNATSSRGRRGRRRASGNATSSRGHGGGRHATRNTASSRGRRRRRRASGNTASTRGAPTAPTARGRRARGAHRARGALPAALGPDGCGASRAGRAVPVMARRTRRRAGVRRRRRRSAPLRRGVDRRRRTQPFRSSRGSGVP